MEGAAQAKSAGGDRDYVREEVAAALHRKIIVVPVRVGREGQLAPLPRSDELPTDVRDLVLYQKHDVTHGHFGRDIAELIEAIAIVRRSRRPQLTRLQIPDDGGRLFGEAERHELEGIVSKRKASPYRSGSSRDWRKIKTAAWSAAKPRAVAPV